MPDTILDDVDSLLLKGYGDKRILEQIKRAAENNEVISIYERNYIAKLKSDYLEKKPEPEPVHTVREIPKPVSQRTTFTPSYTPEPPRRKNKQKTKIIAGIGSVALIAILIVGVFFPDIILDSPVSTPKPQSGILLSADATSYALGDIISISGKSDISLGNNATISITDATNYLVWSENIALKSDGAFSTLTIAGGLGWDAAGTYTLYVEHDDKIESLSFTFQG